MEELVITMAEQLKTILRLKKVIEEKDRALKYAFERLDTIETCSQGAWESAATRKRITNAMSVTEDNFKEFDKNSAWRQSSPAEDPLTQKAWQDYCEITPGIASRRDCFDAGFKAARHYDLDGEKEPCPNPDCVDGMVLEHYKECTDDRGEGTCTLCGAISKVCLTCSGRG